MCLAFGHGWIESSSEVLASCLEVRRTSSLDIPEMDLYAECTQFLELAALEMTARGLTRAKFVRSAGQSQKIVCGIRSAQRGTTEIGACAVEMLYKSV